MFGHRDDASCRPMPPNVSGNGVDWPKQDQALIMKIINRIPVQEIHCGFDLFNPLATRDKFRICGEANYDRSLVRMLGHPGGGRSRRSSHKESNARLDLPAAFSEVCTGCFETNLAQVSSS